jgi:hypothetical protein
MTWFLTTALTAKIRLDLVKEKELRLKIESDYQLEMSKLYEEILEKDNLIKQYGELK